MNELDALRREVADLRAENERLRFELAYAFRPTYATPAAVGAAPGAPPAGVGPGFAPTVWYEFPRAEIPNAVACATSPGPGGVIRYQFTSAR